MQYWRVLNKWIIKEQDAEVKIIQKWDGTRPLIQSLLRDFRMWLAQKRIDDVEELKRQEKFQMTVLKIKNVQTQLNGLKKEC